MIITTDRGFTHRRDAAHHGILVVRLHQPNRIRIHTRIMQALGQFGEDEWAGLLVVMRDTVQSVWRGVANR